MTKLAAIFFLALVGTALAQQPQPQPQPPRPQFNFPFNRPFDRPFDRPFYRPFWQPPPIYVQPQVAQPSGPGRWYNSVWYPYGVPPCWQPAAPPIPAGTYSWVCG